MEAARGCFRHLRTLFQELEECRAFELLKGFHVFRVVIVEHLAIHIAGGGANNDDLVESYSVR